MHILYVYFPVSPFSSDFNSMKFTKFSCKCASSFNKNSNAVNEIKITNKYKNDNGQNASAIGMINASNCKEIIIICYPVHLCN